MCRNTTSNSSSFSNQRNLTDELAESFKVAFFLERILFCTAFYFELVGLYKKECIFLHKTVLLVTSNFHHAVDGLSHVVPPAEVPGDKLLTSPFSGSVATNNKKLFKILGLFLSVDHGLQNYLAKVKELVAEFTLA